MPMNPLDERLQLSIAFIMPAIMYPQLFCQTDTLSQKSMLVF